MEQMVGLPGDLSDGQTGSAERQGAQRAQPQPHRGRAAQVCGVVLENSHLESFGSEQRSGRGTLCRGFYRHQGEEPDKIHGTADSVLPVTERGVGRGENSLGGS